MSTKSRIGFGVGAFLVLTASLLLWLCAFSTPYIRSIYYVGLNGGRGDRLGTFGYCTPGRCSKTHVGYAYPLIPDSRGLTGSLILTSIAAGFGTLGLIVMLIGLRIAKIGVLAVIFISLAAFLGLLSYILALSAFVTTYRRYWSLLAFPRYGPAMWMHLTGMILFLVAIPFTALGCGGGSARHDNGSSGAIAGGRRRSMDPSSTTGGAYKEARDDPEMMMSGSDLGSQVNTTGVQQQLNDTSNINETYRS